MNRLHTTVVDLSHARGIEIWSSFIAAGRSAIPHKRGIFGTNTTSSGQF